MKKQISSRVGSGLTLFALSAIAFGAGPVIGDHLVSKEQLSLRAASPQNYQLGINDVPLYHRAHAAEILGEENDIDWSPNRDIFSDRSIELTQFINNKIRDLLPKPWRPKTSRIARALIETSNRQHMDPLFLMAMISHESKFNPAAVGTHGEIGLMQVKPETARTLIGESSDSSTMSDGEVAALLENPETNIAIGASYLSSLRSRFKGHSELYIAAYNMGALSVRRHLSRGDHPKIYLNKILRQYAALTEGYSLPDFVLVPQNRTLVAR